MVVVVVVAAAAAAAAFALYDILCSVCSYSYPAMILTLVDDVIVGARMLTATDDVTVSSSFVDVLELCLLYEGNQTDGPKEQSTAYVNTTGILGTQKPVE